MDGRAFRDREDAGRRLARMLEGYADRPDVLVFGLPRGGVPVAYEIARALGAPLDVFVVRKLGTPGQEELAMGAIASGGVITIERSVVDRLGLGSDEIASVVDREMAELARREAMYRLEAPSLDAHGKTVIVVDDGLATGSSMRVAVTALRKLGPARVIVAVPVAAPRVCRMFTSIADECYCLVQPEHLMAVGSWYEDFSQTSDEEVRALLHRARADHAPKRVIDPTAV